MGDDEAEMNVRIVVVVVASTRGWMAEWRWRAAKLSMSFICNVDSRQMNPGEKVKGKGYL